MNENIIIEFTKVDRESDTDDEELVGAQAPKLTKLISSILKRYPEGGQILKVYLNVATYVIINVIRRAIRKSTKQEWQG